MSTLNGDSSKENQHVSTETQIKYYLSTINRAATELHESYKELKQLTNGNSGHILPPAPIMPSVEASVLLLNGEYPGENEFTLWTQNFMLGCFIEGFMDAQVSIQKKAIIHVLLEDLSLLLTMHLVEGLSAFAFYNSVRKAISQARIYEVKFAI